MAYILLIDDANSMRELLPMHLKRHGHELAVAEDAIEGIKSILSRAPDLIVSDLQMPYMDGLELLKAIRGDDQSKQIPVIMLTSNQDDEKWMDAMKSGVTDYLLKPVAIGELVKAINKALRGRKSQ